MADILREAGLNEDGAIAGNGRQGEARPRPADGRHAPGAGVERQALRGDGAREAASSSRAAATGR